MHLPPIYHKYNIHLFFEEIRKFLFIGKKKNDFVSIITYERNE
nr:MAG TPA: hypothetical protein [Caudoviricetes sp.]